MNIIKHVFSFIPSPTSFAAYYEKRIHNANTTFRCMSIARICMSTEFMLVCVLPSLTRAGGGAGVLCARRRHRGLRGGQWGVAPPAGTGVGYGRSVRLEAILI